MRPSTDSDNLEKKLENKRQELRQLHEDMEKARAKDYDLGPYLNTRMELKKDIEKLEQALARANQGKTPQQMQYDVQSVLSGSVVRRRTRPTDPPVKLEDKTSQGDRNRKRSPKKSQTPTAK